MNYKQEHDEIVQKIARQILGTATEQDLKDINDWKAESKQHEHLYEELIQSRHFSHNEEELKTFPFEEGWEQIEDHIEGNTFTPPLHNLIFNRIRRYAAVILLCLIGAATGTYYYFSSRNQTILSVAHQIPPGSHSARLTLNNGQILSLSTDQSVVFNELNGIKIRQTPCGLSYIPTPLLKDTLIHNCISTLTGMEYQLTLADSTRIFINAESTLKYPVMFQGKERLVEMEGEAYFQVTKNKKQPFIVQTGDLQLKVLGTSFNVRAYKDEPLIQITLESGIVEVNGQKLYPGDQLCYHRQSQTMSVKTVDTKQYVAWHEGHFLFRNERLEDILRTLARWYKFDYTFDDEPVKNVRIGAYFQRYNSMEPILNMLIKTNLVKVSEEKRILHFASVQ